MQPKLTLVDGTVEDYSHISRYGSLGAILGATILTTNEMAEIKDGYLQEDQPMQVRVTTLDGLVEIRYARYAEDSRNIPRYGSLGVTLCASALTPDEIAKIREGAWMVLNSTGHVVRPEDRVTQFDELFIRLGDQDVEEARHVNDFRSKLAFHAAFVALFEHNSEEEYEAVIREYPDQLVAITLAATSGPYSTPDYRARFDN